MSSVFGTAAIVIVTFLLIVLVWRLVRGYYPGSKYIIEAAPPETNGLDKKHARFMFFYASWCPWCRKADPIWRSFKKHVENTKAKFGGMTIIFEEINIDHDKGKTALYNIKEYPTFKLETRDTVYKLVAIPNDTTFEEFLVAILGKKTVG
jgi:thiol-disulfide isomerase/thioredoxin